MPLTSAGIQAGAGIVQAGLGFLQSHKAQKQLERLNVPAYAPNQGISNYYKTALDRYNTNPYASQQYTVAQQNAGRSLAAGLGALSDRRGGIAGVSRLTAINNDAMLRAGAMAEQERNQRFGQLGQATGMKAADDKYAFQINQLMPYQQKYNLLAGKAAGGNQIMNAGLQNVFGGLQTGSEYGIANSIYGGNNRSSGPTVPMGLGNSYGSGGPVIL